MLNLDKLNQPLTQAQTSIGTLYLYRLRVDDLEEFMRLPKVDPISRIREFIPRVASLTKANGFKDERPSLSKQEISFLSNEEINHIADLYVKQMLKSGHFYDSTKRPNREPGEQATNFLDRLLMDEANFQSQHAREINNKLDTSFDSLFDGIRASTRRLGSTLNEFDKLKQTMATTVPIAIDSENVNAVNEHRHIQSLERAKERSEIREMVRLTAEMTAESATCLKNLVEKSATLLEQMEARSKKSDRDTRTQVLIAVCAVATSAFLSLFSFIQDKNNYETGDRWQRELLDSLRQNNQVRNRTREEIQLLKHDAAVLRAQLKAAKGSASKDQQGNQ